MAALSFVPSKECQNVSLFPHDEKGGGSDGDLEKRIGAIVIRIMEMIIKNRQEVFNNYKKDITFFDKGFFFPREYVEMLQKKGLLKRLKFVKEEGIFIHGYMPPAYFTHTRDLGRYHEESPKNY